MKERGNHSDEGSLGNTFHGGETCFNLFPSREAHTLLSACPAWERARAWGCAWPIVFPSPCVTRLVLMVALLGKSGTFRGSQKRTIEERNE